MGKTTRNAISNDQKREICQYKKDNPKAKNIELINKFDIFDIMSHKNIYVT
jgi:hypothetical protein